MSVSSTFGISGKLAMPTFQWHKSCKLLSFDRETTTFGIKGCQSDFLDDILFSSEDFGQLGDALDKPRKPASRYLVIFEKLPAFWKLMVWIRKILRAKEASKWVFFYLKHLVKAAFRCFGHNFLISSLFWVHELSIWRFSCDPPNEGKSFDQFPTELNHGFGQTC